MSTSSQSVPIPTSEPVDALNEWCETKATLRGHLGLSPTELAVDGAHPDTRPCPSWCHQVTHPDGHPHDVELRLPQYARHRLHVTPEVPLGLYGATYVRRPHNDDTVVALSHIGVSVEQVGAGTPVITLELVDVEAEATAAGSSSLAPTRMKLRMNEARELIAALQYVVDVVAGNRPALAEAAR